jgi:hypothetical protein
VHILLEKQNIKKIVILLSIIVFCALKIFLTYFDTNGFSFADWLINYQEDGFTRRGLLGTIAVFLFQKIGIKLQYTVFFFQFITHFLFFYFLYKILILKKINAVDFAFLLSPLFLWLFFSDMATGARKDGVLWFLYVFFLYLLLKEKFSGFYKIAFYFLAFVSVFIHESFVFFVPYFLVALYLYKRISIKEIILMFAVFYIPAVIIFLSGVGVEIGHTKTLTWIKQSGIVLQKENIFAWKEDEGLIKTKMVVKHWRNLLLYFVPITLQLLYIYYYIKIKGINVNVKKFFFLFLICFLCSLPLFVIAIDWGRWVYTNFLLSSLLLISFLQPKDDEKVSFFDLNIRDYIFIAVILFASFSYRMPMFFIGIKMGLPLRFFLNFIDV